MTEMHKQSIEQQEKGRPCEFMAIEAKEEAEKRSNCLHGDILETVFSHSCTVDLVAASYVSITWQRVVYSSLRLSPRVWPWLLLHAQSRRNPSQVTVRAYDPHSQVWTHIPQPPATSPSASSDSSVIRSSNSELVYTLTSSKLAFSTDPLSTTWNEVHAPRVCRRDPIVAAVGSHIVVAGGSWEFEDDPCAVEVYDASAKHRRSERCEPMPDAFRGSASSMWLSVAVSDRKMHVIEKNTGQFCSFDPDTEKWGPVVELRPDPLIFLSVIGYSGDNKLVLVGLAGDASNVSSMRLWEVDCDTLEQKEIGSMPPEFLKRLSGEASSTTTSLLSIVFCMARGLAYIYNPSSDLEEVYICNMMAGGGTCKWGSIQVSSEIIDRMDRHLVFTCSVVGIDDLRKVLRPTARPEIN